MVLDILLVLIITTAVSTRVLPPENVTVSCHNFQTQVYWNHSEQRPQRLFKLSYVGDFRTHEVNTTKDHHDFSSFLWRSEELDRYHVNIMAMSGIEESEVAQSPIFTFNDLKTADVKCKLDFPPIDLRMKDMGLIVSFANPFHYYKELEKSLFFKDEERVFSYELLPERVSNSMKFPHQCTMCSWGEETCSCRFDIPVPVAEEGEQYCVRLEGSVMNRIKFSTTVRTCVHDNQTRESHIIVFVVILFVVFSVVIIAIALMVCKARAWKNTPSTFPKTVASLLANPSDRRIMEVPREYLDRISVVEPASAPLLESTMEEGRLDTPNTPLHSTLPQSTVEEGLLESPDSTESEDSSGVPIGREQLSELVEMIRRPCSGTVEDTNSGTLGEEEISSSGYDRAHRLDEM